MFPYAPYVTEVLERWFTLEMHRVYQAAQRIHVRGGVQNFVKDIFWSWGSNFSDAMTLLYVANVSLHTDIVK